VARLNESGAPIVFVSLGCPKQEQWMAEHRGRVQVVMVGVGAAFDFHAGTVSRAPAWMQHNGLEWLPRLLSEPRRLWRRYLVTNTLFIVGAARQLLGSR
jgi:N-acetylglucosaminyldiphosphoundecaprenol N-acetyl-beta-D-mannosaminyltransferase